MSVGTFALSVRDGGAVRSIMDNTIHANVEANGKTVARSSKDHPI
ncbi:MAG: hypothetical protein ACJAXA_003210, partial [Candidatus Aldehydirespiratoraceae bacterium]